MRYVNFFTVLLSGVNVQISFFLLYIWKKGVNNRVLITQGDIFIIFFLFMKGNNQKKKYERNYMSA